MNYMSGWELDRLTDALREAQNGKADRLSAFLREYSPFAATNQDYSLLLILRRFESNPCQDGKKVLNCPPHNKNYQWGITIATATANSGSQANVYLPNCLTYTGIGIAGEQITIRAAELSKTTNVAELHKKLHSFGKYTEAALETAFDKLSDEQYAVKKANKPAVKDLTIENKVLGTLTYAEEYGWYQGVCTRNDLSLAISIICASPQKLAKVIQFAEQQMIQEFYKDALLAMEEQMIFLKNDAWLGEGENGEEELPITAGQFKARVFVEAIHFYDDYSSAVYCNDHDIFYGHTIVIDLDKKGKFKRATLAG